MEHIEEITMQVKAVFEDIEQYNINKILYCENCTYNEKLEVLKELKDKLVLLLEEVECFENSI